MLTENRSAFRCEAEARRHEFGVRIGATGRSVSLSQRLVRLSVFFACVAQLGSPLFAQNPAGGQPPAPGQNPQPGPVPAATNAIPAATAPLPGSGNREVMTDAIFQVTGRRSNVEVTENLSKVIELQSARITKVDGFDPTVIDVQALTPHRIRVQALIQGVTTLVLTDVDDKPYIVEVFVKGDTRHLQAVINNRFPDSAVEAYKIQDSVALTGWVAQPEHITQIVEIAEQFYPRVLNQMRVGGVQQVQIKVRIMEAQRSKIRNLGFDFIHSSENGYIRSNPAQLFSLEELIAGPAGVGGTLTGSSLSTASTAFGVVSDETVLLGFLNALREERLLKILAEPVLVTTNGRPASMLSGGEFPVLVPQSLGVVSIEWREFGVRMEAVPIILGDGRVRLEVMPEVSERDFANSVTVGDNLIPALTTRKVNTEVEMRFGQTLMLTGLISSRRTGSTSKIPVLGELPWIGAAFRKTEYDDVETELVIALTPELVAPMQPHQVPHGGPGEFSTFPTDRELFLDGFLEVPKYGNECAGCGKLGTCGPNGCLTSATTPQAFATPIQQQVIPAVDPSVGSAGTPNPAPERAAAAATALRNARPSGVRVSTATLPINQRTTQRQTPSSGAVQKVNHSQPAGSALGPRQAVQPASAVRRSTTQTPTPASAKTLQPRSQKRRPPSTWYPFSKKPDPGTARSRTSETVKGTSRSQSESRLPGQSVKQSVLPGLIEP
ncbi:MAG: type II and III secretion system protein family protein [Planctomycetota bacterium]|jgi:pilus assembly protein CpaC